MFKIISTKKYLLIGVSFVFLLTILGTLMIPLSSSAHVIDGSPTHSLSNPEDLCPPGHEKVVNELTGRAGCVDTGGTSTSLGEIAGGVWNFVINPGLSFVIKFVTSFLFAFFGIFLALSGSLLNFAINITIVKMSGFIQDTNGIRVAWGVIRDIANIGFIFMIAYIAISTILQLAGRGIKDLLTKLIIAALLINFSFFFTGVLIDASNIITISVYKQIASFAPLDVKNFGVDGQEIPTNPGEIDVSDPNSFDRISNFGISGVFMQATDILSIFSPKNSSYAIDDSLAIAIFGSIFIFVLTFAFLTIAALLFIRLIVLIVLLVTSPVAYIGSVFPGANNYSKQWWDALWGQLLFAPIYMVMTLVVVVIINSPSIQGNPQTDGGDGFGGAIKAGFAGDGSMQIIFNYLLIIGLIYASIIGAKKYATQGGTGISNAVGKVTGLVDGLKGKSKGLIGRNTVGRALEKIGGKVEDYRKKQEEDETGRYSGRGGRLALKAISGVSRAVEGVAEKGTTAKFGGDLSRKDVVKRDEERDKEGIKKRAGDPKKQAAFIANLDDKAQQKAVSEMSARNRAVLENELGKIWRTQNPAITDTEVESRVETLRKRLSQEDKDKTKDELRKVRKSETSKATRDAIRDIATGPTGTTDVINPRTRVPYTSVQEALRLLPSEEAYKLSRELLSSNDVIDALTPRHLANIMSKADLDGAQIDIIRDRIISGPNTPERVAQRDYINGERVKHYWGT